MIISDYMFTKLCKYYSSNILIYYDFIFTIVLYSFHGKSIIELRLDVPAMFDDSCVCLFYPFWKRTNFGCVTNTKLL